MTTSVRIGPKAKWVVLGGIGVALLGAAFHHYRNRDVPPDSVNRALIFIKPHGQVAAMPVLVEEMLKDSGISIEATGVLTGDTIRENHLIDMHYAAIASAALTTQPHTISLTPETLSAFEAKYHKSWTEACASGEVVNAAQASERFKIPLIQISELFDAEPKSNGMKLGPGMYVVFLSKFSVFVVNGFYARMREEYIDPRAQVSWYIVVWDSGKLSWKDFRAKVIGATDPGKAAVGSMRQRILVEWEELGLPFVPSTGKNCVHASASALEGLHEILVWTHEDQRNSSLGRQLLRRMQQKDLDLLLTNPIVQPDGKPLFDLLEDMDSVESHYKAQELLRQLVNRNAVR